MIKAGVICTHNQTLAGCRPAEATQAIHMTQLNGKRFCGKPVSFTFMTAIRPVGLDGLCADKYQACHNGDPSNIICMKNEGKSDE